MWYHNAVDCSATVDLHYLVSFLPTPVPKPATREGDNVPADGLPEGSINKI